MAPWIIVDDFVLAGSSTLTWTDSVSGLNNTFYNGTASVWNGDSGSDSQYVEWRFRGRETSVYATHTADFAYRYGLVEKGFGQGNSTGLNEKKEAQTKVNTYLLAQYALDEEQEHVARLVPERGTFSLDYILYKPVNRAPAAGLTVLIDDQDVSLPSPWNRRSLGGAVLSTGEGSSLPTNATSNSAVEVSKPMLESIAETNVADSSFSYTFNGSSISVYGAFHQVAGNLRVQYGIDDQVFSTTHFNGSQTVDAFKSWTLNQLLFSRSLGEDFPAPNPSKPDEHTLTVRIEEVSGDQTFLFDYLTFQGTENTIIEIPAVQSFEIDRRMNPGPVAAGAVAVVLLWLYIFFGDKLPFVGSSSRSKRSQPHGTGEGYSHTQPAQEVDPTAKPPVTA